MTAVISIRHKDFSFRSCLLLFVKKKIHFTRKFIMCNNFKLHQATLFMLIDDNFH